MKISQLAAKPQLIKFVLDDEETVAEYGEPLDFYSWDRQPMDTFLKLADVAGKPGSQMIGILKDLILDENGQPVMVEGMALPGPVLFKVVNKLVESLGK
jgi:hypothetical protein